MMVDQADSFMDKSETLRNRPRTQYVARFSARESSALSVGRLVGVVLDSAKSV